MNLVYEIPIPPVIVDNEEIAFMTRLDAYNLIEAYEKGELKGRLKEIAAELDEDPTRSCCWQNTGNRLVERFGRDRKEVPSSRQGSQKK